MAKQSGEKTDRAIFIVMHEQRKLRVGEFATRTITLKTSMNVILSMLMAIQGLYSN